MKFQIAATMSDSVNRKSMKMDTGALYESMKESFDDGMPLLISHDRHRPAGWTIPAAVYLEPGLTRVLAQVIDPKLPRITRRYSRDGRGTSPPQSMVYLKSPSFD